MGITEQTILFKDESYLIQGAVFEVYKEIGSGFLESVYQLCLEKELADRGIPFKSQPELTFNYKNQDLGLVFRPDFLLFDKIIMEIKAVKDTAEEHRIQIYNYLKASHLKLGLLVNFGHFPRATVERIILSERK